MISAKRILLSRYFFVSLIVLYFVCAKIIFPTKPLFEKEKATHFKGRVIILTEDPESGGANKLIHLTNGQIINPPYTHGLWIRVEVGDSIVKEPGNLNYKIFDSNGYLDTILNWDQICK